MPKFPVAAALLASSLLIACDTEPPSAPAAPAPSLDQGGNGAPSGAHFNLNIIGVEKGHENDNDNSNGRRIFVPLGKNDTAACDILLHEGPYDVADYNCLDSDRNADFNLPDPDNGDGTLAYSVWVRALGPKGSATMRTCITDELGTWCNAGDLIVNLQKGKTFVDVSKQLLQVCNDVGQLVPLFSGADDEYFWHYENSGLRLAQLRFYEISTTDIGGDCTRAPHVAH